MFPDPSHPHCQGRARPPLPPAAARLSDKYIQAGGPALPTAASSFGGLTSSTHDLKKSFDVPMTLRLRALRRAGASDVCTQDMMRQHAPQPQPCRSGLFGSPHPMPACLHDCSMQHAAWACAACRSTGPQRQQVQPCRPSATPRAASMQMQDSVDSVATSWHRACCRPGGVEEGGGPRKQCCALTGTARGSSCHHPRASRTWPRTAGRHPSRCRPKRSGEGEERMWF